MIGAIYGDVVGSVYEYNNIKTKEFELFPSNAMRTDDTVMTVAVADAILRCESLEDTEYFKKVLTETISEYVDKYPCEDYGGGFWRWARGESKKPYGSFGNGSAMRVAPVAWCANTLEKTIELAKASAEITHNHEEGIKGAVVTAGAAFLARKGASMDEIKSFVSKYYNIDFTLDEIRDTYKYDVTCQGTVPQSMQAFFESVSFEDAIRNAISIGGDSDTLAAITGAVAEAYYGIELDQKSTTLTYLEMEFLDVIFDFQERFMMP